MGVDNFDGTVRQPGGVHGRRHPVLHRLPRRVRPDCCPARRRPAAAGQGRTAGGARRHHGPAARHHDRRRGFDGGVVMAGDRRATAGNMIAKRDIEKVFRSDEFSCVGIAGVAGIGLEFVRLFQVELEHYEKIEGRSLSAGGQGQPAGHHVRGNLGAAMQGLAVVPLFAGYDEETGIGPHLQLRRGRRPVRGAPLPLHRLRLGVRPRLAEEALPRRHARRPTRCSPACRRCTTRPTTTRPPAAPT